MILVKFGGSVTTNKETFEEKKGKRIFYRGRTKRLIGELKSAGEDFMLVHGAGSFGHPLAKRHELKEGYTSRKQIPIVAKVQRDVRYLNVKMMEALDDQGLPSVSLPPGVLVTFRDGELRGLRTDPFKHYLKMGVVPVTFGDVVPDVSRSFGICSGDDLMLQLAKEFKPRMAIFVTKVDGIFTKDPGDDATPPPQFIDEINEKTIKLIEDSKEGVADVTGRMGRKARMMLRIADEGVDCIVLNGLKRNRLRKAMKGEKVKCTIARGKK